MVDIYARQARSPRRKKGQPPFFMWRTTVGLWLLNLDLSLGVFNPLHGHHRSTFALAMILLGGYFVVAVETRRYTERFTRPRRDYLPQKMI